MSRKRNPMLLVGMLAAATTPEEACKNVIEEIEKFKATGYNVEESHELDIQISILMLSIQAKKEGVMSFMGTMANLSEKSDAFEKMRETKEQEDNPPPPPSNNEETMEEEDEKIIILPMGGGGDA